MEKLASTPFIWALVISLGIHIAFFWRAPMENPNQFQASSGQSMALTLGAPPVPKKLTRSTPTPEQVIMTAALDAQLQVAPKKPEPEPEIIKPIAPDIKAELEELIVTKEVQLSSKPIAPVYPEKARRDKQEGLVLVRAQVNEQGKTLKVKVSKSSGFPLLDKAAIEAIAQWSFLPAKQNEQAIMAWIEVPIDFKLR